MYKSVVYLTEIALLYEEKRIASVIAVEMCDIYFLKKMDFNEVLEAHPEMRNRMYRSARRRLKSIVTRFDDTE